MLFAFQHHTLRAFARCVTLAAAAAAGCGERAGAPAEQLARGQALYATHCAACHGAKLEGQPNWRERLPNGKFPAPPHDATGHTWHHPDELLFNIVKNGIEAYAPPGHQSDMPAFGKSLSDDDIRAVLAYIKSTWPEETRKLQTQMSAKRR
jgi:mono/diheme cytochrome c family protein